VEKDFHLEVIQVKEERAKAATGGFQRTKATRKSWIIRSLSYEFFVQMRDSQWVESRIYTNHKMVNRVCLEKRAKTDRTTAQEFPSLST
jgi:hypothetical protein